MRFHDFKVMLAFALSWLLGLAVYVAIRDESDAQRVSAISASTDPAIRGTQPASQTGSLPTRWVRQRWSTPAAASSQQAH